MIDTRRSLVSFIIGLSQRFVQHFRSTKSDCLKTGIRIFVWTAKPYVWCTRLFLHFRNNKKSSQNKVSNCFCAIASTGIEPVFPPWEGGVLAPWPTGHIHYLLSFDFVFCCFPQPTSLVYNTFFQNASTFFIFFEKISCFSCLFVFYPFSEL